MVILTMTEFGRTSLEDGSNGTDHGNASSWFIAGGGVVGGIYGEWPTLATGQLYRDRYLQHTVDFRDIMGDIWLDPFSYTTGDIATLLPEHSYQTQNLFGIPAATTTVSIVQEFLTPILPAGEGFYDLPREVQVLCVKYRSEIQSTGTDFKANTVQILNS